MGSVRSGVLWAVVGRSRSGKTVRVLREIQRHRCVLIWDVEGQYTATHRARTPAELWPIVKACAGKKATIAYTGALGDFDQFCKMAFYYVQRCCAAGQQSAVVFEETADVTNPGKAPEHYGIFIRRSLKYGVDVFAITQRPAESDKTSIGNASIVYVCALKLPRDRKSVAELTGIPLQAINGLVADQAKSQFDFILQSDHHGGNYQRGRLIFTSENRPRFTLKGPKIPL